jgi:membrane associated rhomboid family serine protease
MTDKKSDRVKSDSDNIIDFSQIKAKKDVEKQQARIWSSQAQNPGENVQKQPFINMPNCTKYLLGIFVIIHVISEFWIPKPMLQDIRTHFGFVPQDYWGGSGAPLWSIIISPVTYAFLHGNWTHLLMNGFMLAAFGSGLERVTGAKKFIIFFFVTSVIALSLQFLLAPHSTAVVIGASGGLSGLFGAVLLMFYRRGMMGHSKYGLWPIIIIWVVISIVFGLLGSPDGADVAWAAHLGGFFAGLALAKPMLKI